MLEQSSRSIGNGWHSQAWNASKSVGQSFTRNGANGRLLARSRRSNLATMKSHWLPIGKSSKAFILRCIGRNIRLQKTGNTPCSVKNEVQKTSELRFLLQYSAMEYIP